MTAWEEFASARSRLSRACPDAAARPEDRRLSSVRPSGSRGHARNSYSTSSGCPGPGSLPSSVIPWRTAAAGPTRVSRPGGAIAVPAVIRLGVSSSGQTLRKRASRAPSMGHSQAHGRPAVLPFHEMSPASQRRRTNRRRREAFVEHGYAGTSLRRRRFVRGREAPVLKVRMTGFGGRLLPASDLRESRRSSRLRSSRGAALEESQEPAARSGCRRHTWSPVKPRPRSCVTSSSPMCTEPRTRWTASTWSRSTANCSGCWGPTGRGPRRLASPPPESRLPPERRP